MGRRRRPLGPHRRRRPRRRRRRRARPPAPCSADPTPHPRRSPPRCSPTAPATGWPPSPPGWPSPDESVTVADLATIAAGAHDHRSVLVVADPAPSAAVHGARPGGRPVADFAHRAGMITKPEVRSVVLGRLDLPDRGVLWDVGAGSGSVAIEAALAAPGLRVIAVERRADDAERIVSNAAALGAVVEVVVGGAPDVLADLPRPDRVFVGGGGLDALDAAWDALGSRWAPGGHVRRRGPGRGGPPSPRVAGAGGGGPGRDAARRRASASPPTTRCSSPGATGRAAGGRRRRTTAAMVVGIGCSHDGDRRGRGRRRSTTPWTDAARRRGRDRSRSPRSPPSTVAPRTRRSSAAAAAAGLPVVTFPGAAARHGRRAEPEPGRRPTPSAPDRSPRRPRCSPPGPAPAWSSPSSAHAAVTAAVAHGPSAAAVGTAAAGHRRRPRPGRCHPPHAGRGHRRAGRRRRRRLPPLRRVRRRPPPPRPAGRRPRHGPGGRAGRGRPRAGPGRLAGGGRVLRRSRRVRHGRHGAGGARRRRPTASATSTSTCEVVPGVTAAHAAAGALGAPLAGAHAVVSLSDLLVPWATIEAQLRAAAQAGLPLALYNPRSQGRPDHLDRARRVLLDVLAARHALRGRDRGRHDAGRRPPSPPSPPSIPTAAGMRSVVLIGTARHRRRRRPPPHPSPPPRRHRAATDDLPRRVRSSSMTSEAPANGRAGRRDELDRRGAAAPDRGGELPDPGRAGRPRPLAAGVARRGGPGRPRQRRHVVRRLARGRRGDLPRRRRRAPSRRPGRVRRRDGGGRQQAGRHPIVPRRGARPSRRRPGRPSPTSPSRPRRCARRPTATPTGAVFVIGNAPTALFEVIRLAEAGRLDPALVIGLPVGFVGAADVQGPAARAAGSPPSRTSASAAAARSPPPPSTRCGGSPRPTTRGRSRDPPRRPPRRRRPRRCPPAHPSGRRPAGAGRRGRPRPPVARPDRLARRGGGADPRGSAARSAGVVHRGHGRAARRAGEGRAARRPAEGWRPVRLLAGGEEALALQAEGIDVQVTPGVTAATAAPLAAGVPAGSAVTVAAGNDDPVSPPVGWTTVGAIDGAVVVLIGRSHQGAIADGLIAGGRSVGAPAALVHAATRVGERVVSGSARRGRRRAARSAGDARRGPGPVHARG